MPARRWAPAGFLRWLLLWIALTVSVALAQSPGEDASPYGPPRSVLVLVETALPAEAFRYRYERTGAVLLSETAFPNVSRAIWEFSANIQQFSLLRASLAGVAGASVVATSSRGDEPVVASSYSTSLWNLDRLDQTGTNYDQRYDPGPGYTGAGVNTYVLDTGVVPNHPDLSGRVVLEYSAYAPQYADDNGHGSHVSGTIAGTTYGVAKQATIRSYKILDGRGGGTIRNLANALTHLRANVRMPAVINLSLTYSGYDSVVDALLQELLSMGVHVFAAAGNRNIDACSTYPCITSGVVCMGATTRLDQRSSFSNFGACVDLFGPGSDITSISRDGVGTALMSGTSMSSPHGAGVAALALQVNPHLTPAQLARMLIDNSIKNQLLSTTLGARSNNRMLYAVWGSQPTTATMLTVSSTAAATTATGGSSSTVGAASSTSTARATTTASARSTSTASTSASRIATSTLATSTRGTTTARATSTASTTLSRTLSTSSTRAQSTTVAASTTRARTTTRSVTTTVAASSRSTRGSKTVSQAASAARLSLSLAAILSALLILLG